MWVLLGLDAALTGLSSLVSGAEPRGRRHPLLNDVRRLVHHEDACVTLQGRLDAERRRPRPLKAGLAARNA